MKAKALALGAIALAIAMGAPATAQQATSAAKPWYKQPFDPARVQPCDRACLVGIADQFLKAMETQNKSGLPLAEEVYVTENSGRMSLGEGLLWHASIKPTNFRITVADPVSGQVAVQMVYRIDGHPAMVAIRLKVERRMITEVEQLYDRNVAPEAMELLTTPRPTLLADVPRAERSSREYLVYAASAYFDALTGEDGRIAPFAEDCVRHEQGYQTVNNKTPGRASPTPKLPDTSTEMGRIFSKLSTMTCEQQISTGIFVGVKKIWPRRMVVDEQKGLVAVFPLFVHDGTKRPAPPHSLGADRPGIGMVINLVTMETFGIRGGKIHEVEAFPFVTLPYGLGDGWTPATGR
ncbi:MAG TPA: hypothetical protein VNZ43_07195 [Sphingomonadaceae bacterium]|nr:hypothetical protein [Sphingomonadaceae bacterium]